MSLTILDVYTKYNVNEEGYGGDPNSVMYYYTSEVVNTAVPALNESTGQNGHVLSCYVIVNNGTRDITINHDGLSKTIELITLPMNEHVTLKGDVSRVGYSDFTYTVTTESLGGAGYDETWGNGETELKFPYFKLGDGNVTISDNGEYYIYGDNAQTANTLTINGNATQGYKIGKGFINLNMEHNFYDNESITVSWQGATLTTSDGVQSSNDGIAQHGT